MALNYTHIIAQAYEDILLRGVDPGGLANWQARMNDGLSEVELRAELMRSAEFRQRFPGPDEPPDPPEPPPTGSLRAAFTYPWFPQTWTVGGEHVDYHPTLGYYSSDDAAVIDSHIRALDYAKVQLAIVSWWGQKQQKEDTRIPLILDRIRALGSPLRVALYYEKEGFGNPDPVEIAADLAYIKSRYTSRPEFAKRAGKPILFVFNADDGGCSVVQKWLTAAPDFYLNLKVFGGWENCQRPNGGWHQYGGDQRAHIFANSFNISPGYWQANEPQPRLSRDLAAWKAAIKAQKASGAEFQLITSFNEWGEGTAVESALEWQTASGHGAYLDALHNDGEDVPVPPAGKMEPLRVEGNRFVQAASGASTHLQGMILCCDDEGTPGVDEATSRGWPLMDHETLRLLGANDQNYAHFRMGPFSTSEPNPVQGYARVQDNNDGGVFDLERWDAGFWHRLRELLQTALDEGVYVELDLIDVWGLDHEVTPWSAQRNIQGTEAGNMEVTRSRPGAVHERWIRKVVRETASFPNVLYSDGNESWKTSGTVWCEGVIAIAKDELARMGLSRPVGSNNEDIPANADYLTFHQKTAAGARSVPVMVNEYQTIPVEQVLSEAKRGRDIGTSFHYWRGGHSWDDTLRTLNGLKVIVNGGEPPPVADKCPVLSRWGSSIHLIHAGGNVLDIPTPVQVGGSKNYGQLPANVEVVCDSTPRFGPGRGFPCNEEKGFEACGGRNCEDPRGPVWELLEAPAGVRSKVGGNPFQFHVGPLLGGSYRLKCSPRPDCKDALGESVDVGPNASTEIRWSA